MSVVDPLSAIETAPNAFVSVGCAAFTTRHWSVEVFVALVVATFADRFVNAAGFVAQLAFVCATAFVTPATVTVHEAVAAAHRDAGEAREHPRARRCRPHSPAPSTPPLYVTAGVALLIAAPWAACRPG